jgi:hypothetical protein
MGGKLPPWLGALWVVGAVIYLAGVAAPNGLALIGVVIFVVGFGWAGIRLWT